MLPIHHILITVLILFGIAVLGVLAWRAIKLFPLVDRYDEMTQRAIEQQNRQENILVKDEERGKRVDALIVKWEDLTQRIDAVLKELESKNK